MHNVLPVQVSRATQAPSQTLGRGSALNPLAAGYPLPPGLSQHGANGQGLEGDQHDGNVYMDLVSGTKVRRLRGWHGLAFTLMGCNMCIPHILPYQLNCAEFSNPWPPFPSLQVYYNPLSSHPGMLDGEARVWHGAEAQELSPAAKAAAAAAAARAHGGAPGAGSPPGPWSPAMGSGARSAEQPGFRQVGVADSVWEVVGAEPSLSGPSPLGPGSCRGEAHRPMFSC